jgi:hypothetical protein
MLAAGRATAACRRPAFRMPARLGLAWPGDTFGIAVLPDGSVSLTWGSAIGTGRASAIYAAVVTR